MEFERTDAAVAGELGARVQDVVQEAIDAVSTTYTNDAGIDVEEHLRLQLAGRGVRPTDERWFAETARQIRAGHDVTIGRHDGSMDPG
jgi:hypothetical protein